MPWGRGDMSDCSCDPAAADVACHLLMRWCDTRAPITMGRSPALFTAWEVASSHSEMTAARAAAWARLAEWVAGGDRRALVHLQLRIYRDCDAATALRHATATAHDRFLEFDGRLLATDCLGDRLQ